MILKFDFLLISNRKKHGIVFAVMQMVLNRQLDSLLMLLYTRSNHICVGLKWYRSTQA